MQLIYIHGFNSDANSVKGQMLQDWCTINRPEITVLRPDLNKSPLEVVAQLEALIAQNPHTGVVGSSLGGFFATVCVARYGVKAVLVNPSVRPFERFQRYFTQGETSYTNDTGWTMTPDQLTDMRNMFAPVPAQSDNILLLLKKGDETLDYREAESYYGQDGAQSPMIIEEGGDHFMHDMDSKIPLIINFLFDR